MLYSKMPSGKRDGKDFYRESFVQVEEEHKRGRRELQGTAQRADRRGNQFHRRDAKRRQYR
jgi:hypothetical protein